MADYTIVLDYKGLPLLGFIEVKTAKGKQSEKQKAFQKQCDEGSICYILARSVEDVQQGITNYIDRLTSIFDRWPEL